MTTEVIQKSSDLKAGNSTDILPAKTLTLNIGVVLRYPDGDHVIINVTPTEITLCKIKVKEFSIRKELISDVLLAISTHQISIDHIKRMVVEERDLDDKYRDSFDSRKKIIRRIADAYGPDYLIFNSKTPKKLLSEIAEEEKIAIRTLRNWLLDYLQSGLSEASLVDKRCLRNAGRPSGIKPNKPNEYSDIFDEGITLYKKARGQISLTDIYEIIFRRYFCTHSYEDGMFKSTPVTDKKIPGFWPFYRYYRSKVTLEEQDKIKMGSTEQRNNKRLRTGSADTGVSGAYDVCEMDAWESDFRLRDEAGNSVGGAVVYMIKDVATRMIVAISVAYDNNSIIGCTNCIANLNEDKQSLLAEYGLKARSQYSWLTGFKPRAIRIDNGADFVSDQVLNIFNELAITPIIVSPGMGSYKGVVERSFRDIRETIGMFLIESGYKTGRYGEKPDKEALLTIRQFTKLIYAYVLAYNESVNVGIVITNDMAENHIPKIPARVMEYYFGLHIPQRLPVGDDFLRVLLSKGEARISKDGLKLFDLIYFDDNDKDLLQDMYARQTKGKKFFVLYDPRNVNLIYYIKNGALVRVPLNLKIASQRPYKDKTFAAVRKMMSDIKQDTKKAKDIERDNKTNLIFTAADILGEASAENPSYSCTKNIRESREIAKQKWSAGSMALEKRIGTGKIDLPDYDIDLPEIERENEYVPKDYSNLSPTERLKAITGEMFEDEYEN